MGIIGSIRKHSWIAVAVVGVAIVAFIIGDLTKNNRGIPDMGKINGSTITYQRFNELIEETENNYKRQQGVNQIPADVEYQLRDQVWQTLVGETLTDEQFEKLGLTVSPAELNDMYVGTFIHPYLRQSFTDPKTGEYQTQAIQYYVDNFENLDTNQRMQWVELEKAVKTDRKQQKYSSLISRGMYMPTNIAKQMAGMGSKVSNAYAVNLSYQSVSDDEITLTEEDYQNYYNKHKDEFMTVPGYELYHVQGDSAKLANLFAETPTLEQFKAAAYTNSSNQKTAKDSGYVGHVKQNYALPYGIGMVNDLSAALEGKEPGFVTPVIRANDMKNFHRFYLAAVDPAKLKTYDRVGAGIEAGVKAGTYFDVDSSTVLITVAGKPVFTEADLLRFNDAYFHRALSQQIHQRMVQMIAETFAYAELAKEAKLNHSWEYRALYRFNRLEFLSSRYIDKKLFGKDIPEDSLKAFYDRVGKYVHPGYTYEQAKDLLHKMALFPENMYKHDYYMCYRVFYAGKTYEQSMGEIYNKLVGEYTGTKTGRFAAEAYEKADVHLYDTGIAEFKPYKTADKLMARADSLYQAGKKSDAYYAYRDVMYGYAEDDSLFERVAYEMAQIQGENEEYMDAEGEYYAFYTMWPNSPNAEKAMFSRGFMLNENLGWNDKALGVLEEFLQKYPNSELKESAQWLIDNIKSNGKLADDLMKKIEAEE